MRYDLGGFVVSLVVAVVLAALALWVRFGLQRFLAWLLANGVLAGVMMGGGITAMHYTGIAGCALYRANGPAVRRWPSDGHLLANRVRLRWRLSRWA